MGCCGCSIEFVTDSETWTSDDDFEDYSYTNSVIVEEDHVKYKSKRAKYHDSGTNHIDGLQSEYVTFESDNKQEFFTHPRGFDTNDSNFNPGQLVHERDKDGSWQKKAEIMCRFRPEQLQDDQCVQYGNLDAYLKRDTNQKLDDDRWDALTRDQSVSDLYAHRSTERGYTHDFEFDRLFPPKCTNKKMYNILRKQWFPCLVSGISVGIIPYGVSGSGKSHTVHGSRDDPGMAPLFCQEVFQRLERNYDGQNYSTKIRIAFLEIWDNKVVDLLKHREEPNLSDANEPLDPGRGLLVCHDEGKPFAKTPVLTATDLEVSNEQELLQAFWMGYDRLRRQTLMDQGFSRTISLSNSILIITILRQHKFTGKMTNAQFQVVDLGGPFKVKELAGIDGSSLPLNNLRVLAGLNESILALRKVMLWSDAKSCGRHKPYRDSKVTHIMEPLLEKGKTAIIIHISGCSSNAKKTTETLRFGFKASQLYKVQTDQDIEDEDSETSIRTEEEIVYYNENRGALPRGVSVI